MEKRSVRKDAVINSFWDFITKLIEKIGSIIFTILLARFLLPEGFGIYSLTLSITLIFADFVIFAPDNTLIRYLSHALGKRNQKMAASYFRYLLKIKLILSFIAALLLLFFAYPLSEYVFRKSYLFSPLFISGFYIFTLAIGSFYDSIFYAFQKLRGRFISVSIYQSLRIFITLSIFFLVAKSYYVIGTIFGLILTNLIVFAFMFFYIKKFALFLYVKENGVKIEKKKILKFLFYLSVNNLATVVLTYVDIIMLGIFLPEIKYTGFYNSAASLIWGLTGLLRFSSVFLPIFTQIKKEDTERIFNKVMKYSFLVSIPSTFGIVVLARYILLALYGIEYTQATLILQIMAFVVIESVNSAFLCSLFYAKEKPKLMTRVLLSSIFLNISLNFILINFLLNFSQLLATIGAAISTLIGRYFLFISLTTLMKKQLDIKLYHINWIKPLIASLVMVSCLYLLNQLIIKDFNLFWGIFEIFLGIIVYSTIILLIKGASKEELFFLKRCICKIKV